jgi:hypothetical protein
MVPALEGQAPPGKVAAQACRCGLASRPAELCERELSEWQWGTVVVVSGEDHGLKTDRTDRFRVFKTLRALGLEPTSGLMIGILGQSYAHVATDIETLRRICPIAGAPSRTPQGFVTGPSSFAGLDC